MGQKYLIILLCSFILVGCASRKQIEYVDRVVVEREVVERHDTVTNNVHDSIYHTVFQKGDTIYNTKYVEHTKWRDRVVYSIDTVYRDSVQTQIEKTTVEKKVIPNWCYFSLVAWLAIIIFIIIKVYKWVH